MRKITGTSCRAFWSSRRGRRARLFPASRVTSSMGSFSGRTGAPGPPRSSKPSRRSSQSGATENQDQYLYQPLPGPASVESQWPESDHVQIRAQRVPLNRSGSSAIRQEASDEPHLFHGADAAEQEDSTFAPNPPPS